MQCRQQHSGKHEQEAGMRDAVLCCGAVRRHVASLHAGTHRLTGWHICCQHRCWECAGPLSPAAAHDTVRVVVMLRTRFAFLGVTSWLGLWWWPGSRSSSSSSQTDRHQHELVHDGWQGTEMQPCRLLRAHQDLLVASLSVASEVVTRASRGPEKATCGVQDNRAAMGLPACKPRC